MLELSGVNAGYGDIGVLFDICLKVREGEVVTLLGRNGVGKTTTLKAIVGLARITRGKVTFGHLDITSLPSYKIARSGIGYVPEERRIFPDMTVEENLRVTRRSKQTSSTWPLKRLYDLFPKLEELRHRNGGLLSGGEQQMLSIARTLAGGPKVILLDEPSEGLAPVIVQFLRNQIAELKREGLTILLCEQNLGFARALSDRVYLIDRGSIQYEGSFAELDANETVRNRHLFVQAAA